MSMIHTDHCAISKMRSPMKNTSFKIQYQQIKRIRQLISASLCISLESGASLLRMEKHGARFSPRRGNMGDLMFDIVQALPGKVSQCRVGDFHSKEGSTLSVECAAAVLWFVDKAVLVWHPFASVVALRSGHLSVHGCTGTRAAEEESDGASLPWAAQTTMIGFRVITRPRPSQKQPGSGSLHIRPAKARGCLQRCPPW